jgi:dienelactone hydrolase
MRFCISAIVGVVLTCAPLMAADTSPATRPAAPTTRSTERGDRLLADYFRDQTSQIAGQCLADVKSAMDWEAKKGEYRRQLADMLGLWPTPEKTDLKAVVSGTIDEPEYTVEKLSFQSRPGLYVTGDLYVPKGLTAPAPAILYVCGHAEVKDKITGVSYGNKTAYQHHGIWFARNGYVCLVIDTLQLGEIEGIHHGTYREKMWWWHSRGYTPAGVEAWNGIRALDYLTTRKEVDASRIGMTGRSGGGAYTWWVAALDDRVKVAVPVAGITDLQNHVVDGTVEGHCDCMFMVNTYRWDFAQVAALVSPRPLLIANSDKDTIFPLDGVYRLHEQVRRIYKLQGAEKNLGLLITEGPHKDTQDLQVPAFRWFNRFLKGDQGTVDKVALPAFRPEQLKVWKDNPTDQLNTTTQETFVPKAAEPDVPNNARAWTRQRTALMKALREQTFRGWPKAPLPALGVTEAFSDVHDGVRLRAYDFVSQEHVPLRLYVAQADRKEPAELVVLNVLDEPGWNKWLAEMRPGFEKELKDENPPAANRQGYDETTRMLRGQKWAMAWVAPRGVGPTAWDPDEKKDTQIRRRFALLGQTVDGMRVWDVRRAIQALRETPGMKEMPLWLQAEGRTAGIALYASLFEPKVARLDLWNMPTSHRDGPDLLNVLKTLDLPTAVALAAERSQVRLYTDGKAGWDYPKAVAARLGWGEDRVILRGMGER